MGIGNLCIKLYGWMTPNSLTCVVCEHHKPQVIPDDVHDFLFPFPTPISCSHPISHPMLLQLPIKCYELCQFLIYISPLWNCHFFQCKAVCMDISTNCGISIDIPVYYSPATVHKKCRNLLQKWRNTMLGKHTRLGTAAITIQLQIIVAVCFVSLRLVGLLRYHTVACTCWGTLICQNLVSWMPCTSCCKSLDIYLYQL